MAKSARKPAAAAAAEPDDENFALRSLQQAHAKNRRYKAGKDELLKLYEQMLLIRRFEVDRDRAQRPLPSRRRVSASHLR